MNDLILNFINPILLIGIGIALFALEAVVVSFIVIWFAIATIIVGIASLFINFNDGVYQLVAISVLATTLLLTLRNKTMNKFLKPENNIKEDFLNVSGVGVIKNDKIFFQGTYWNYNSKANDTFENDEKVNVISTNKNTATIEKIL